jgi:hypothetical protein
MSVGGLPRAAATTCLCSSPRHGCHAALKLTIRIKHRHSALSSHDHTPRLCKQHPAISRIPQGYDIIDSHLHITVTWTTTSQIKRVWVHRGRAPKEVKDGSAEVRPAAPLRRGDCDDVVDGVQVLLSRWPAVLCNLQSGRCSGRFRQEGSGH